MNHAAVQQKADYLPFTYAIARELDLADYDAAADASDRLEASYDPLTQTSDVGVFAGSRLTYCPSFSGLFAKRDDKDECDT